MKNIFSFSHSKSTNTRFLFLDENLNEQKGVVAPSDDHRIKLEIAISNVGKDVEGSVEGILNIPTNIMEMIQYDPKSAQQMLKKALEVTKNKLIETNDGVREFIYPALNEYFDAFVESREGKQDEKEVENLRNLEILKRILENGKEDPSNKDIGSNFYNIKTPLSLFRHTEFKKGNKKALTE